MATEITTTVEETLTDSHIDILEGGRIWTEGVGPGIRPADTSDVVINNAGWIVGDVGILIQGDGRYVIRNTGDIDGTSETYEDPNFDLGSSRATTAVSTSGDLDGLIVNRGSLYGPWTFDNFFGTYTYFNGVALYLGGSAETVVNHGRIYGDVRFAGSSGNDTFINAPGATFDGTLTFGETDDTAKLYGTVERVSMGDGADTVVIYDDGAIERLNTGHGDDVVHNFGALGEVDLQKGDNLYDAHRIGTATQVDSGIGDDTLIGGRADDVFLARHGDDRLLGGGGNDILKGGNDADVLIGGAGRDKLFGETGDDTLSGGVGRDRLTGGPGADLFVAERGGDVDIVADFNPGEGDRIDLTGIDIPLGRILARANVAGGDTILKFGGGDVMVLADYARPLDADDFLV
ncbi:calcium-binding protein [Acuticoccus kandeliae]|uniref:calcium-binding protein n=1 Tax=Acuticoccus kandeliae TaxID=2073160 RepID=UPI000D3EA75B|nr:calcium-binding protein [Acuticoccus kandeliae]